MNDAIIGLLVMATLIPLWIIPIRLGIQWAHRKGISPHWMWFGIHPVGGWIAFAVIRWGVNRIDCSSCNTPIPVTVQFCPNCNASVSEQLKSKRLFRWWKNEVQCANCKNFVKFNSRFCPSCSAPSPRLVCPKCGSDNTQLVTAKNALLSGITFLVFAFSSISVMENAFGKTGPVTWGHVLTGGLAALFTILAMMFFIRAFTRQSKQVSCLDCNEKSKIDDDTPKVSDPPIDRDLSTLRIEAHPAISQAKGDTSKSGSLLQNQGSSSPETSFTERDNLGTRHASKGVALAYWMGERLNSTRKDPFVMFTFKKEEEARNGLLGIPCIHVASDSQKLICTERLIFGYYAIEDVYEAILCGDALTVELWEQAKASFSTYGGEKKNDLAPTRHEARAPKAQAAHPEQVVYVKEERKSGMGGTAIYRVYKGPDEQSAMAFLQQNPVTQNLLYLVVETPEGNFCRDAMGIYKEDT